MGVSTDGVSAQVARAAQQLEVLSRGNAAMAHELDAITARGTRGLNQATVSRLEELVDQMRSVAAARQALAGVDEAVLLAGVREWLRRRAGDCG